MKNEVLSRRQTFALGSGVAAAILATTGPAAAYQGNMERAIAELFGALGSLREATPNKGGHRERAIGLIQQAIGEVQAGIDFAAEHGGG